MKTSTVILTLSLALVAGVPQAWSQTPAPALKCDPSGWKTNGLETFCKIVEIPAPFGGSLAVAATNGAVSIRGWDGADVLVRARIQTSATTLWAAEALAGLLFIDISAGRVQANGPAQTTIQSWNVGYEVFVPRLADVELNVNNGAISIADVQGHIQFSAGNGAVSLVHLAGQVGGKVGNGAISIVLGGDHWEGQGLDVKTQVGAIAIDAPHDYSAHFDSATTVGTISTNYPVPTHSGGGFWGKAGIGGALVFDAGSGGATLRVSTMVGAIRIQREDQ